MAEKKKIKDVVSSKTNFIKYLSVDDGLEVFPFENDQFVTKEELEKLENDENLTLNDLNDARVYNRDEIVVIENTERTRKFLITYAPKLYSFRGIKNPDEIDENDPYVKELVEKTINRKVRQQKKNRRRVKITPSEKASLINRVRRVHKPHSELAFNQMLLLSLIYHDVFTIKGSAVDTKFEIEIPEAYWQGAKPEEDSLDKLLEDYDVIEPFMDESNPLEYMVAYTTTFFEKNPKILEYITENLLKKAYVAVALEQGGVEETDDIAFLEAELDELLS